MKPPKELQDKWYAKLKKSGFEDIENERGDLKASSTHNLVSHHGEYYADKISFHEGKAEYYRLAGFFLHDKKFESKLDKQIWELHANDRSIREIVTILKKKKIKAYRDQVHIIIQRLAKEMIKMYVKK